MLAIIFFGFIFSVGILGGVACFMIFSNSSAEIGEKAKASRL